MIMGAHFLSIIPNCNCTSECEYLIRLVFQDHLLLKKTRASTLKQGEGVRVYDKHKHIYDKREGTEVHAYYKQKRQQGSKLIKALC